MSAYVGRVSVAGAWLGEIVGALLLVVALVVLGWPRKPSPSHAPATLTHPT